MTRREAEGIIAQALMEKIEADLYPSATQMDMVEQLLTPELTQEYLGILMDKVMGDTMPSIPMLRRMIRVAGTLPVAELRRG